jgi:hypothetical protein
MSVMNCNNCTKYVRDQKLSIYYGAYTTKHSTDCEKALAEAIIAIEKHELKVRKEQEKANEENQHFLRDAEMQEDTIDQQVRTPCISSYSIGLGKLLSSIRASTSLSEKKKTWSTKKKLGGTHTYAKRPFYMGTKT